MALSRKEVKANKAAMVFNFNRLMSLMKQSQRALLIKEHRHKIGLDNRFYPVTLGYKGNIKRITWEKLCEHFVDDRTEEDMYSHSYGNYAVVDCRSLPSIVCNRIDGSRLMDFVEIKSGSDIHDVFLNKRPGSCMGEKGDSCTNMRMLYENNPDVVDVVVFGGDCGLTGGKFSSWLRWKFEDGTSYFDEAYYSSDCHLYESAQRKLTDSMGAIKRHTESPPDIVTLYWDGSYLPYMDTYSKVNDYGHDYVKLTWSYDHERYGTCSSTSGFMPRHKRGELSSLFPERAN